MRVTYRGHDDVLPATPTIKAGTLSISLSETLDLTAAELKRVMAADPLAVFDVEPSGTKREDLGSLAVELEKRGVSVHPLLGGSKKPKGHARWEAK